MSFWLAPLLVGLLLVVAMLLVLRQFATAHPLVWSPTSLTLVSEQIDWLYTANIFTQVGLSSNVSTNTTILHVHNDSRLLSDHETTEVKNRLQLQHHVAPFPCARTFDQLTMFANKLDPQYHFPFHPMHSFHDVLVPIVSALIHADHEHKRVHTFAAFHRLDLNNYGSHLLQPLLHHFNVSSLHLPRDGTISCFSRLIITGYDRDLQFDPARKLHKLPTLHLLRHVVMKYHAPHLVPALAPANADPSIVRIRFFTRFPGSRHLAQHQCLMSCLAESLKPHGISNVSVMHPTRHFGRMVEAYHSTDILIEASGGQGSNHLYLPLHAMVFTFAPCGFRKPTAFYWTMPYLEPHTYHQHRWCIDEAGNPGEYTPATNLSCHMMQHHVAPLIIEQVPHILAARKLLHGCLPIVKRADYEWNQTAVSCDPKEQPYVMNRTSYEVKSMQARIYRKYCNVPAVRQKNSLSVAPSAGTNRSNL